MQGMTTGLPALDNVLKNVLPGDNIVWQVDTVEDYQALVLPFCDAAVRNGVKLTYFRFASHPPLLPDKAGIDVVELRPEDGFESFISRIHRTIEQAGRGAFYVFDCLSELAAEWYSDQMLGNFFMLTCPYLFDLETVTYFGLFRDFHSTQAIDPITNTTQLFLDVYRHRGKLYVRPLKVQHRYTSTMHMLHVWENDQFAPVSSSAIISEIMASSKWAGLHSDRRPGTWERAFIEAQEVLNLIKYGRCPPNVEADMFERMARMALTRDDRMLRLISKYFTLEDALDIRRRMIGSGLVGGKTVGMLAARAILRATDRRFGDLLEEHDSFYIGSDVFYTFLVRNGVWWVRDKQRRKEGFLEGAELARQRILTGTFPDHTLRQIGEMLDYFGQSPVIVRSSSLLEDNFGNSFAGKYDSVFCANQGPRERRLEDFLAAIRTVYASTMSEKALRYRAQRGLLEFDEQMALLIMRVSGTMYGRNYYPAVAGVGFSFNPYVWNKDIDPKAGVVRMVFGMGTRAVDRSDDDYTRVVALNAPEKRPEGNFDEIRQYAQRRVDYIDLDANHLVSGYFGDVAKDTGGLPMDLFASPDRSQDSDRRAAAPILTFDRLMKETAFVDDLRDIHRIVADAYEHPVDVEFTANFTEDRGYKINLVQCRPLQVRGADSAELPSIEVRPEDRIIEARGAVIGHSRLVGIDRFIYVVPSVYGSLPMQARHEIARLLGSINRTLESPDKRAVMLIGPGRWGTSSPELGVPVNFADISRVSVLCEVVTMRKGLVPDVSLGTHFLNELVEMDMLYLALFPTHGGNHMDSSLFESAPNSLSRLVPDSEKWEHVVRVINAADIPPRNRPVHLLADSLEQKVVCYLANTEAG